MTRCRPPAAPSPPDGLYQRILDPVPAEIAAYQNAARDWLLLWSRWRRTWTAIARFGPEPLIIDHPDPIVLLQRCRVAELTAVHRQTTRG